MKKLAYALAFVALAAMVVFGVGCSGEDKYHVYKIDGTDADYVEYDVVYYDSRSNYKSDVLTGFVDETHYYKKGWSLEEVESIVDDVYPGARSLSFVTVTTTEEADYYCCIVRFDDLDNLDNIKALHDGNVLLSRNPLSNEEALVDAAFFGSSIVSGGGVEVAEDEVSSLGLHFNAK